MKTIADLDAARAHNAKFLGLAPLPGKTQDRLAWALACAQGAAGLEPDGAYDRATEVALDAAIAGLAGPAPAVVPAPSATWPPFDGPPARRPGSSTAELVAAFGDPREGGHSEAAKASDYWEKKNLVDRGPDDPLPGMYTTGPGRYVSVHRLVMPYLDEALRRVRIAAPTFRIESLGGYCYRHMRHNASLPLSIHSWGAAVDLNSDDNFSVTYGVDEDGPEPWSPAWLRQWKGNGALPREVVEAFESVGWIWGGRWRAPKGKKGFRDPMHLQLAGGPAIAL